MTLMELARSLERSALALAIRDSMWGFAILITVHVLALGMFLGTVMLVDLRLIGHGVIKAPVSDMVERILPWTRGAFAVMALSGLLLFSTEAAKCYASTAFRVKIALIVLATLNVWLFHRRAYEGSMTENWSSALPRSAPMAGILSLVLWIGALAAGRAVGYDY